jgi:hypothetical protein
VFAGHLYFSNVMPSDHLAGALYKCTVHNPALRTAKGGSLSRINIEAGEHRLEDGGAEDGGERIEGEEKKKRTSAMYKALGGSKRKFIRTPMEKNT